MAPEPRTILFPKEDAVRREVRAKRVMTFLAALDPAQTWELVIRPWRRVRSTQQNAYLWGYVYPTILREGGEHLAGWSVDDLHDFFLGDCFGWEETRGFGMRRLKPQKRSSRLTTLEFSDYIAHIQRFMAEKGVILEDPDAFRSAA